MYQEIEVIKKECLDDSYLKEFEEKLYSTIKVCNLLEYPLQVNQVEDIIEKSGFNIYCYKTYHNIPLETVVFESEPGITCKLKKADRLSVWVESNASDKTTVKNISYYYNNH